METSSSQLDRVRVSLGERSYDVLIGNRLFDTIGSLLQEVLPGSKILVAYDAAIASPWLKLLFKGLTLHGYDTTTIAIPSGEASKSSEQVARLWTTMANHDFARDSAVIALGGGMVGDLAGFAAATFLRGISFIQIPTTLLGMVDSSVGGKTGINLPQGKNLVGAFWQPRRVVADIDCLGTLSMEERLAGMAEVIKYGIIRDAALFQYLEDHIDVLFESTHVEKLRHVIRRSVEIKAEVVTADEREDGLRRILNFGHTIGHAVEAEGNYGDLRHGECVAIGMVAASMLALERNQLGWREEQHKRLVKLIERAQLPVRIPEHMRAEALLDRTRIDKKVKQGRVRYILPARIGEVEVCRDLSDAQVLAVLRRLGAQ